MKRETLQKYAAEAEKTPNVIAFVNAHPELVPGVAQNIWAVSHVGIAAIRGTLGLTQAAFAAGTGFTKRTVENWEEGRAICRLPIRLALAEIAGLIKVPLEW